MSILALSYVSPHPPGLADYTKQVHINKLSSNTLGGLVFTAADVDRMTVVFSSERTDTSDNMMLLFSGKHNFGTFPCVSNNPLLNILGTC